MENLNKLIWTCSFIFLSAPYLSVAKLRIDSLTTVLYDRQTLCRTIGLAVTQLPLLACLLGNDVVSEDQMQHIRNDAMATYRCLGFLSINICCNLWILKLNFHSYVLSNECYFCRWLRLVIRTWMQPFIIFYDGEPTELKFRWGHYMTTFLLFPRINNPTAHSGASQGQMVLAVSHLVSSLWGREEEETELIPQSLNLSAPHRELLKTGICSYLLPGQEAPQRGDISALPSPPAFEKHVSPEILKVCSLCHCSCSVLRVSNAMLAYCVLLCFFPQACREKHVAAEGFMVYSVLCEGVTECSNTLEDEEDAELLPQALVYKPCRRRAYGLLLLHGHDGRTVNSLDGSHTYTRRYTCTLATPCTQSENHISKTR